MKLQILKFTSLFFKMFCLSACLYQTFLIVVSYFSYETGTRTNFQFPKRFEIKDLSMCYRFRDIIDVAAVSKKYNFTQYWKPVADGSEVTGEVMAHFHHTLKISDTFEYTPREEDFIESCIIPISEKSQIPDYLNKSECYKNFKVQKYFMMEFICYRIAWKKKFEINLDSVGTAFFYTWIMYNIKIMRNPFYNTQVLIVMLHDKTLPILSRYFGAMIRKRPGSNSSEDYWLTFSNLEIKFLGYPYSELICDPNVERYDCLKECVNRITMERYGRMSPEFIFEEPIENYHLGSKEFMNLTFCEEFDKIQTLCHQKCHISSCYDVYTVTSAHWLFWQQKVQDLEIVFRINSPHGPFVKILVEML